MQPEMCPQNTGFLISGNSLKLYLSSLPQHIEFEKPFPKTLGSCQFDKVINPLYPSNKFKTQSSYTISLMRTSNKYPMQFITDYIFLLKISSPSPIKALGFVADQCPFPSPK